MVSTPAPPEQSVERIVEGIPASPGIAIAHARLVAQREVIAVRAHVLDDEEIEIEVERLLAAITEADKVLERIEAMAREDVHDRAGIFEALRMMLADPTLATSITDHIRAQRTSAQIAIAAEMGRIADIFANANDETMRTRADDIHALQSHLVGCLLKTPVNHDFHNDAVLVLTTLSPSDTVLYARNKASAFVLETGGINSHSAILARAFAIPMVACVKEIAKVARPHATMIVDGYTGRVIIDPTEETVEHYMRRRTELQTQQEQLGELRDMPAVTIDGERVTLAVNLGMIDELDSAVANGAEEVGLMRTEFLLMGRTGGISMEEQAEYYQQLASRAYPMPVTIRLFDIGSDKLSEEVSSASTSPLGMRGLRLLLTRPDLLEPQVEAILRASTMKNLRLMLPMVTSVVEVRAVRGVVEKVSALLRAAGVAFDERIPIGAMIETPAAAVTADRLASVCDFFSLGTNDLAQYTLTVDRTDEVMAEYYEELHPAVLRMIRATAVAAARGAIPLTICGELAANPLATEILIGLGLRRLSVQPHSIGALKQRIRQIDAAAAYVKARQAVRLSTTAEVEEFASATSGGQ